MQQRGNTESRTACALLVAMDEREITIDEFSDAIDLLTPEALQVIATALRSCAVEDPRNAEYFWQAHRICSKLAAATRVMS